MNIVVVVAIVRFCFTLTLLELQFSLLKYPLASVKHAQRTEVPKKWWKIYETKDDKADKKQQKHAVKIRYKNNNCVDDDNGRLTVSQTK